MQQVTVHQEVLPHEQAGRGAVPTTLPKDT